MKKVLLSVFALAAILTVSCNKVEQDASAPAELQKESYTIVAESGEKTKTAYADDKTFSWTSGDEIAVVVVNSEDPAEVDVEVFTTKDNAPTANFSGTVAEGYQPKGFAVYPADAFDDYDPETDALTISLNANQFYAEYSDAPVYADPSGTLPLVAKSSDGKKYSFESVTGLVKFTLTNIPAEACWFTIYSEGTKVSGSFPVVEKNGVYMIESAAPATDREAEVDFYFSAEEGETRDFYVPLPEGVLSAGSVIYLFDASFSTALFTKEIPVDIPVTRNQVTRIPAINANPWVSLGTAKYNDYYFTNSYKTFFAVELEQNSDNPSQFRIENPFVKISAAFGYTTYGTPSAYLGFEVQDDGLVNFDYTLTGIAYSRNRYQYSICHPSFVGATDVSYNKVLREQADGLPANIQLAPYILISEGNGNPTSILSDQSTVNNRIQIVFPGCEALDYTIAIDYIDLAVDNPAQSVANVNVTLGADVEYANVVIAEDPDEAYDLAQDGTDPSVVKVTASGQVQVNLPAGASSGNYTLFAQAFADGEAQIYGYSTFYYFNTDEAKGYTLDDLIGTYTATVGDSDETIESLTVTFAASDNAEAGNIMITDFSGIPDVDFTSPIYGTFDMDKGLVYVPAGQVFGSLYDYYDITLEDWGEADPIIFEIPSAGTFYVTNLAINAYDDGEYLGWWEFLDDVEGTRIDNSSSEKPITGGVKPAPARAARSTARQSLSKKETVLKRDLTR